MKESRIEAYRKACGEAIRKLKEFEASSEVPISDEVFHSLLVFTLASIWIEYHK